MISATVTLAFTAGMVATFNPCGFSLLPAYIGAFVAGDEPDDRADRRLIRAVRVAAAVSVGFVMVFSTLGLVIDRIASEARQQLPWVTIALGIILVVLGFATAAGWQPKLAIRSLRLGAGARNGSWVMIGYGITYAVASLSCTIGPFLAVTGAALTASPMEAAATYAAYALGMGVIILALSIAAALAHTTIAHHMRRVTRVAPRVGGILMILAGLYAVWYGRWELAVYDGDLTSDPVISRIENTRLWIVAGILRVGAGQLALVVVVVAIATVVFVGRHRRLSPEAAQPGGARERPAA